MVHFQMVAAESFSQERKMMMAALEMVAYCILVIGYGAICYMCGKGDLLNLILLMLLQKAKEIEEAMKDEDAEDGK